MAHSVIGSTIRQNGVGNSVTALNSATFTRLIPDTIDSTHNVGLTSDNDGSLINDSGAEVELDVIIAMTCLTPNSVRHLFTPCKYNGSWSEISADYRVPNYINNTQRTVTLLSFPVTLADGEKVGVMAKRDSGSYDFITENYVIFVKSRDNTDPIPLIAQCSTTLHDNNIQGPTKTRYTWQTVDFAATVEGSLTVGATTDSGKITNDTGETQIVDGFIFYTYGTNGAGSSTTELRGQRGTGGYPDAHTNYTHNSMNQDGYVSGFFFYSTELEDGERIALENRNVTTTGRAVRIWSIQHTMMARP